MANIKSLESYKRDILSRRPPRDYEGQRLERWKHQQVSQLTTVLIREAEKDILPEDMRGMGQITPGQYLTVGDKLTYARQAEKMLNF